MAKMTLDDLLRMNTPTIPGTWAAEVMKMDPTRLIGYAREKPHLVSFPFQLSGNRMKIPPGAVPEVAWMYRRRDCKQKAPLMLEHQRSSQRKDRLMKHLDCNTKSLLTKGLILTLALVLSVAAYAVATEINRARAESITTKAWIISSTYVNVRMSASKNAPIVGLLDPGDNLEIDGHVDGWFAHIVAPVDGWIHSGYLTFSEPKQVNQTYTVTAKKRLVCRRWIDGPKVESRPYLITGSEVKVLWISDDWACTNRGYLKTEWLEANGE